MENFTCGRLLLFIEGFGFATYLKTNSIRVFMRTLVSLHLLNTDSFFMTSIDVQSRFWRSTILENSC